MGDAIVKRQQEKILKLEQELAKSNKKETSLKGALLTKDQKYQSLKEKDSKKIKSLKRKLNASKQKCRLLKEKNKKKAKTITLQPIKRHKYAVFIVLLSVQLYVKTGCGLRGVVTILSILKEILGSDYMDIPCYSSIENWVKKSGLSIYKEPEKEITKDDYGMITDESMMIGSQKLLLTLGVKAEHKEGKTLAHSDAEVLGISVRSSWNGEALCEELKNISERVNRPPSYVISDNGSVMNKGIREFQSIQIKDVSHTLGMIMERVYSKDDEFNSYMKSSSQVKFREIMNPVAYLLPPKQRTVARFLNLSPIVDWSEKMLNSYNRLMPDERKTFSFIPKYASFIDELRTVLSCINAMEREFKHEGLSHQSVKNCKALMKSTLFIGNERMIKMAEQIVDYLNREVKKLPDAKTCWHNSTDIIESTFGVYKAKKATNPLHGVTPFVLLIPLHTRIGKKDSVVPFDFKHSLESVFMSDIDDWKKSQLPENMVYKRIKTLNL
jgi:hypothetical protein